MRQIYYKALGRKYWVEQYSTKTKAHTESSKNGKSNRWKQVQFGTTSNSLQDGRGQAMGATRSAADGGAIGGRRKPEQGK